MGRKASIKQARAFRRTSSVTEDLLWQMLRDRKLDGLKFRRQVPMGPYILDFLCLRHRLVVEADGPFHDPEHDARRDAWLASRPSCGADSSRRPLPHDGLGLADQAVEALAQ